ncbi:MAG: cyclomaltodextrinase N-terminal domain-containing protein, partial [Acidobacteriota bacterium]
MLKIKAKIFCISILILCSLSIFSQNLPKVEKVEPQNWWANHTINPVRLLVRGENLQKANVTNKNRDLAIGATRTTKNGKYLFVSVLINKAKPGKYSFDVTTPNGKTSIPFEVSAPLDEQT